MPFENHIPDVMALGSRCINLQRRAFTSRLFDGSVALPVAGYNYNGVWTPLLAGLSPAGMAASLAQWCCWLCRLCDDISEFESYMPCHAVRSLPANVPARLERQAGMLDGAGRSISGAELPRACSQHWSHTTFSRVRELVRDSVLLLFPTGGFI